MRQADRIREYVYAHHVVPARAAGERTLTMRAGDVVRGMGLHHRVPAVCSVLGTRKFLESAGLDLVKRSGPEQSTTTKFHYAIGLRACEDISDRTVSAPPLPEIGRRPRDDAGGITARMRDAVDVIQCAKSKDPNAGHLRLGNGRRVMFVADPAQAPRNTPYVFKRPDDVATGGRSWRETLIEYNRKPEDNPFGLLPAWRLYRNGVYGELIETFGVESVFILSAGWGLIASEFLTPSYDIAFSGNAERYKRRRRRGGNVPAGHSTLRRTFLPILDNRLDRCQRRSENARQWPV